MERLQKVLAGAVLAAWMSCAGEAGATCVSAPDLAPLTAPPVDPHVGAAHPTAASAVGPTRADHHGRVIAPVTVNGRGPYRFIVDTGANRSVLSTELSLALGLESSTTGDVHSIEGITPAPLVDVESLNYGAVALANASLPVLGGPMMGGEAGVLGVDGMRGKRLRLDFDRRCIEIIPAHGAPVLRGWVQVRGELRFGNLVVVPGRIGNVHVNVLIDTGSDISLANFALRDAVGHIRVERSALLFDRAYSAGRPVVLENAVIVPNLRLGSVSVTDLTLFVANYHIFELWGLQNEPTLLIGMDVLQHSHAIAIDYERGLVHLRMPGA